MERRERLERGGRGEREKGESSPAGSWFCWRHLLTLSGVPESPNVPMVGLYEVVSPIVTEGLSTTAVCEYVWGGERERERVYKIIVHKTGATISLKIQWAQLTNSNVTICSNARWQTANKKCHVHNHQFISALICAKMCTNDFTHSNGSGEDKVR